MPQFGNASIRGYQRRTSGTRALRSRIGEALRELWWGGLCRSAPFESRGHTTLIPLATQGVVGRGGRTGWSWMVGTDWEVGLRRSGGGELSGDRTWPV